MGSSASEPRPTMEVGCIVSESVNFMGSGASKHERTVGLECIVIQKRRAVVKLMTLLYYVTFNNILCAQNEIDE